jgi:hypothetical protein
MEKRTSWWVIVVALILLLPLGVYLLLKRWNVGTRWALAGAGASLIVGLILLGTTTSSDGTSEASSLTSASSSVDDSSDGALSPAQATRVTDLDGLRCEATEAKFGRCPDNKYYGLKPAAARAAKAKAAKQERARAREIARRNAEAERRANAWKKGYNEYEDGIAYKWDNSVCDSSFIGCFGMRLVTRDGCDNLYVELQLQDNAGNAVGMSNDTASGLAPGQVALLDFPITEDRAQTGQISEITCY